MKILLKILGKKVVHDGQTYLQYPGNGWRKKVMERILERGFEKKHKDVPRFQIHELTEFVRENEPALREQKVIFVIDIQKDFMLQLQITHPVALYDITKNEKYMNYGYVVHWTFDPTGAEQDDIDRHERFKNLNTYKEFFHSKYMEDIDTYSYDCLENPAKVTEVVTQILREVFLDSPNTKYLFTISENGRLE